MVISIWEVKFRVYILHMEDLNKLFAERLKEARTTKGFTQHYLAELADLNVNAISKYERGSLLPGTDNLQRLAKALEISIDYLVFPHAKMDGIPIIKDPELYDLYFSLEELSPQERDGIVTILKSLVAQQKIKAVMGECAS